MVFKKIETKNSVLTLTTVLLCLLVGIGVYFMGFMFVQDQVSYSNVELPQKYNDTFKNLSANLNDMDDVKNDISDNLKNISEAEDTAQVAWNGLKGLGNTLKLISLFVGNIGDVTMSIFLPFDFIPNEVKTIIFLGIIMLMIILVLSILKGDQKM